MFCNVCGAENKENSVFCETCGSPLTNQGVGQTQAQTQVRQAGVSQAQPPMAQQASVQAQQSGSQPQPQPQSQPQAQQNVSPQMQQSVSPLQQASQGVQVPQFEQAAQQKMSNPASKKKTTILLFGIAAAILAIVALFLPIGSFSQTVDLDESLSAYSKYLNIDSIGEISGDIHVFGSNFSGSLYGASIEPANWNQTSILIMVFGLLAAIAAAIAGVILLLYYLRPTANKLIVYIATGCGIALCTGVGIWFLTIGLNCASGFGVGTNASFYNVVTANFTGIIGPAPFLFLAAAICLAIALVCILLSNKKTQAVSPQVRV